MILSQHGHLHRQLGNFRSFIVLLWRLIAAMTVEIVVAECRRVYELANLVQQEICFVLLNLFSFFLQAELNDFILQNYTILNKSPQHNYVLI